MNVLFIVLNELDYLDDILAKFLEIGVKGATILDSQGMASALSGQGDNLPLFGSLMKLMDGARPHNKTIFTLITEEEILNQTIAAVQEILSSSKSGGTGVMFTLPVKSVCFLNQEV